MPTLSTFVVKILTQTSTQLIIRHSPMLSWLAGVLLLVIGISMFAVPATSSDEARAVYISAWASIGFGVFVGLSGRVTTWVFDKESGNLLVKEKTLFSTKASEYSLQEISDIKIESKVADSDGQEFFGNRFGVKLILSNKQPLHLCTDYSLPISAAQEAVYRLFAFLKA